MKSKNDTALVAYVASPHAGYLKMFRAYEGSTLYILGDEFVKQFPSLIRHLPGNTPQESQKMILALGIFSDVQILTSENIDFVRQIHMIYMPDEDVSHAISEKYFAKEEVIFDGNWRLRWHWDAVTAFRRPEGERIISVDEFDRELMRTALALADKSPDWWRQIGALLVKDGKVLLAAFNQHVPHDQSAYLYGDPRSNFEPGQCIEVSSAAHAEMVLAGTALAKGICTKGCELYASTFPCPPCAAPWALAGLHRLYYSEGYSNVSAAETFDTKGVEIIRVEMNTPPSV